MKMKKMIVIVITAFALLAAAGFAAAWNSGSQEKPSRQQGQFDQNRPPHPPPSPILIVLDSDRNHEFSTAEINNAAERLLTLDKNGDGILSSDELRPTPPDNAPMGAQQDESRKMESESGHPGGPPPDPIMLMLDTNRDNELDSAEITGAADVLRTIDQNGDGILSQSELRAKGRELM